MKASSNYHEHSVGNVLIEYRVEELLNEPTGEEVSFFIKSVSIYNELTKDWVEVTDSESIQAAEAMLKDEYMGGAL